MHRFFTFLIFVSVFIALPTEAFSHPKNRKRIPKVRPQIQQSSSAMPKEATEVVLAEKRFTFLNPDCEYLGTCDLKSIDAKVTQYKIVVMGDWSYGTVMEMEYKTDFPDVAGKYRFVTFVLGCVFDVFKTPDGGEARNMAFHAKDWIVLEPNRSPPAITYRPVENKIKIIPHSAFAHSVFEPNDSAINVSLEFNTCLFNMALAPNPLYCLNWQSSYIYNFALNVFESKNTIDPFCIEEPSH